MVRSLSVLRSAGMAISPHCCGGGGGFTSIFNTTYNINLGGGCFGGGLGGFWGGLGLGIGQCLGGLFGGMFGGFGMGGMFGGFGNFWGGLCNFWGGGSGSGSSTSSKSKCDCDCSSRSKSTEGSGSSEHNSDCTDIDSQKLADYMPKVTALENNQNRTQAEVQTLYDEIKKAKDDSDTPHKVYQDTSYQDLLNRLKKLGAKDNTSPISITNGELTDSEKTELTGFGTLNGNEFTPNKKLTIRVLKLIEKGGYILKAATNSRATDKWIAGKISGVTSDPENPDKVKSYIINCQDVGIFGLTFKIEATGNKESGTNKDEYKITYLSGTPTQEVWVKTNGRIYAQDTDGVLKRAGEVLVTKRQPTSDLSSWTHLKP